MGALTEHNHRDTCRGALQGFIAILPSPLTTILNTARRLLLTSVKTASYHIGLLHKAPPKHCFCCRFCFNVCFDLVTGRWMGMISCQWMFLRAPVLVLKEHILVKINCETRFNIYIFNYYYFYYDLKLTFLTFLKRLFTLFDKLWNLGSSQPCTQRT